MRNFRDIMAKAEEIRGVPFAELAKAHGIEWSDYPEKRKSLPGRVTQAVFGIPDNPSPDPDMEGWGIEIKSIPVTIDLRVQERTKIKNLNPKDVREQEWPRSKVFHKLKNILFVPVVKPDKALPGDWYFRTPFIWMPSVEVEHQLDADYEAVRKLVQAGEPGKISSAEPPKGQGVHLIANTAGANKKDLIDWGWEGRSIMERRRAWMLRRSFTQTLIDQHVRYVAKNPSKAR